MNKIKVLLVGSGNVAREHYKAFSCFDQFKFVGVVARNKKKLSKFSSDLKISYFSNNLEEAHLRLQPDLVIVATSITSTYKICCKLTNYKSVIFVEKPLGYNYIETKKLFHLFKLKRKKVFIALNRRNYVSTRKIQRDIDNKVGQRVVIANDQSILKNLNNKFPKKIIKNYMYANSIHLIDYFSIFCRGKLKNIRTFNKFNKKPYFVNSKLYFSSGDVGIYSAIYDRESPWYVSIFVGKTIYILKPLEKISSNSKLSKIKIKFADDKKFKPGFKLQASEVLNYFKKVSYNLVDYEKYFESVKLINKIYK